jgi:hypothetical protein
MKKVYILFIVFLLCIGATSALTLNSFSPAEIHPVISEPLDQNFTIAFSGADSVTWFVKNTRTALNSNYTFVGDYDTDGFYLIQAIGSNGTHNITQTWNLEVQNTVHEYETATVLLFGILMFFFLVLMIYSTKEEFELLFLFIALWISVSASSYLAQMLTDYSVVYQLTTVASYLVVALLMIYFMFRVLMFLGNIRGRE